MSVTGTPCYTFVCQKERTARRVCMSFGKLQGKARYYFRRSSAAPKFGIFPSARLEQPHHQH